MRGALLGNIAVFALLFALHIVFASQDLEVAFSIVAVSISLQVVMFGPVTVVLEGAGQRQQRRKTNRVGFLVALPLSFGLAWAYGGMSWSAPVALVVLAATVFLHAGLDRQLAGKA